MKLYKKDEAITALQSYKAEIEFALAALEAVDETLPIYIPHLETHNQFSNTIEKVCKVTDGENVKIEGLVCINGTYIAAERLNDAHTYKDDNGHNVSVIEIFTV